MSTTGNQPASPEPRALQAAHGDPDPVSLTVREREVLARIAAGMTSKEIAAALGVRLRTVNTHREHLAKKLKTSSVAVMVRYAIVNGINHPE